MSAPRRADGLALAGYLAAVLLFFFPVTLGAGSLRASPYLPGTLPLGPDDAHVLAVRQAMGNRQPFVDAASAWTSEPWAPAIGRMYRNGELPLWNPFSGFGMPLAANMQSGALFPPRLPLFLWPTLTMWNAYYLLRLVAGGFFTYRFLRLHAVSPVSAFAGGLAFMFTGYVVLYLNMWHLDAELLLPLLMVGAERLLRARTAGAALLMALGFALAALAGSPESLFLIAVFVTLYYAVRAVTIARRSPRPLGAVAAYAGPFALGGVAAVLVASPLLVLGIEYVLRGFAPAHEAGGQTGAWAASLGGAITLIVPRFFDHLVFQARLPDGLGVYALCNYLGLVPVAIAALAPARRTPLFFGIAAIVLLMKSYGVPPVSLLGTLPVFDRVLFWKYNQPLVAFSVAVAMAFALDALGRRAPRPGFRLRAAATLGALALVIAAFAAWHRAWLAQLPAEVVVENFAVAAGVLLALAALLALVALRPDLHGPAVAALALLLFVELFAHAPKAWPPPVDPFRVPGFVRFLRADGDLYRIYALDGVLFPNTAAAYGLSDIRAADALYPSGYLNLVRSTLDRAPSSWFVGGTREEALAGTTLLDLVNVKYVLALLPFDALRETRGWPLVYDGEVKVYRNPRALPRAFVVHRTVAVDSPMRALGAVIAEGFEPRRVAFVEQAVAVEPPPALEPRVVVADHGAHRVVVKAELGARGLLVLTDSFYPGWSARVDGRPAPILRVNSMFRGVVVDAGRHEVEFRYRPWYLYAAAIASIVTLAAALVLVLARRRR